MVNYEDIILAVMLLCSLIILGIGFAVSSFDTAWGVAILIFGLVNVWLTAQAFDISANKKHLRELF